jgi:plastocyanin
LIDITTHVARRTKWIGGTLFVVLFVAAVWTLAIVSNEPRSSFKTATIVINNFTYAPMRLVVTPGERIVVTNDDSVVHTLTSIDNKFNTGLLAPGYSATIGAPSEPGTYDYICTVHRYMFGEIIVKRRG